MRIDSVIVGMDFNESSIAAARWAMEHFAPGADTTLVHVVTPADRPAFAAGVLPPAAMMESAAREEAQARMHEITTSVLPSARGEIRSGKPHEQIVEAAEARHADLIVVGPHGDQHGRGEWLGATAERIVRASPTPVLVAIDPPHDHPRRLLVPIDEGRLTSSILTWAGHLAQVFDADIRLLHVWSDSLYAYVASMARATTSDEGAVRREIDKEVHDATQHWLADLSRSGFGGVRATATVAHGRPGDVVLDVAAESRADLIVMGRSAGPAIAPALFGSTLRTVLHHAKCPVLVIAQPVAGL